MQQSITSFRDSEVRSAGDIMRQMGSPQSPVDLVTSVLLARKSFSGSTKYSYCPYCYQRVKRAGQDFKSVLKPLQSVTYRNLYLVDKNTGEARVVIENEMECPLCREANGKPKKITLDDFSKIYSEPYNGQENNRVNLYDENGLKKQGFAEFSEHADIPAVIDEIMQRIRRRAVS